MPATALLARTVLLEARRSGLPWLAVGALAAAALLAAFLAQVALTERTALQLSLAAALLRVCAVFLVATQVVASTLREIDDKGLELMLSLPIPRAAHYLGRLAGHALAGMLLAACFAAPLALWAPPSAVLAWGVSLAFETALVAAAALFFSVALARYASALACVAGLYVLGRTITAVLAIAHGPLADAGPLQLAARWVMEALALVLPRLDLATRTDWLLYGAPAPAALGTALAGLALYAALLVAAGLFDFQRRNL
jgi:ABC-type transport system involved in multi-copper enzyme maturation permease subunit